MADWLEGFLAMRVHVLIRFGRWPDILELPLPADPELYSTTTAMLHYARGIALSATGRIPEAEAVYRTDLGLDDTLPRPSHPGNVWALHGFHECLLRLGRTAKAQIVGQQLKLASAMADVPVNASCFCRLEAVADAHVRAHAIEGAAEGGCC